MNPTGHRMASEDQSLRWRVLHRRLKGKDPTWARLLRVYFQVTVMVLALTATLWIPRHLFESVNIALLYLLPVLVSAVRWGLQPAIYGAVLGVMAFDYFFIPPIFSYSVSDLRYLISFGVFLAVAILTAGLATSLMHKTREATQRERITASLYGLSRKIAMVPDIHDVGQAVVNHVGETFGVSVVMMVPDAKGKLVMTAQTKSPSLSRPLNPNVLQWVYRHGEAVGYGGKDRPEILYLPLKTEATVHGVLCLGEYGLDQPFSLEQRNILEALSGLAAVSVARITYESQARIAERAAESERVRTAILDSLSHELRTPVTAIMGAVGGLSDPQIGLSEEGRQELIETIHQSVMRMNRLITNLLGMVRLESGLMHLNRRPCDLADILGVVVHQLRDSPRPITIQLPEDLPELMVDEVLIEQALVNVVSNAIKYSPDHSPIEITAFESPTKVRIDVRDFGVGIHLEEAENIFQKFYRSLQTQSVTGMGLGLAICQGIVEAHQGRVWARPASPAGTIVSIELPWQDVLRDEGQP